MSGLSSPRATDCSKAVVFQPIWQGTLGPMNMPLSLLEQSKNSNTESGTLAGRRGLVCGPGAAVLSRLAGFHPLQWVAEIIGWEY